MKVGTTIILGETKSGWIMVSDTQETSDAGRKSRCSKILQLDDDVLVGAAGNVRPCQLILSNLSIGKRSHQATPEDIQDFTITQIVPLIRQILLENGSMELKENIQSCDANFLLLIDGTILEIDGSFCVSLIKEPYHAIGSGSDYALGALAVLSKGGTRTLTRADYEAALKAATRYDIYCSEPFQALEIDG